MDRELGSRGRGKRFAPGRIVATPGALKALAAAGDDPLALIARHLRGDWGDVDAEDACENHFSVQHGFRVLSSYALATGERLWVITEADRSATTLLLPEEY